MGITTSQLISLKQKIKQECQRRNGIGPTSGAKYTPGNSYGSMTAYTGSNYDFIHNPVVGGKIYSEYGKKTLGILQNFVRDSQDEMAEDGKPIPKKFNSDLLSYLDVLAAEKFTGETAGTISAKADVGINVDGISPETSSCVGACTGLCVGSCTGMCNGCLGACVATCGTGCAGGLTKYAY